MTTAEVAQHLNVSKRHIRRAKAKLRLISNPNFLPKILIVDVETSPLEVYVWSLFKQHVGEWQIIKDKSLLSWSAKWLFDSNIYSAKVTTKEAINREDSSIILSIWKLLDQADVIVAHNAVSFDNRVLNARFLLNGLPPPSPYQIIDTKKIAMKNFAVSSWKLNSLAGYFDLDNKISTTFELWKRCVTGDASALIEMETYNQKDVKILEEVYVILRPWIKSHPNCGLYVDAVDPICPNCGNSNLTWGGFYYTMVGKYKTFRCNNCESIGRSRFTEIEKGKRKNLVVSVAR